MPMSADGGSDADVTRSTTTAVRRLGGAGQQGELTTMRKFHLSLAAAFVALALTAGSVLAAVTWHSGPTVTFNGTTSVSASGDGSGFGNQPAVATLTVNATVQYTCVNNG